METSLQHSTISQSLMIDEYESCKMLDEHDLESINFSFHIDHVRFRQLPHGRMRYINKEVS